MLRDLFSGLSGLIYPSRCILCKDTLTPVEKMARLCYACQARLQRNRPPFCRKCSRPLENPAHAFCLTCQDFPAQFDRNWGVFLYNDAMQRLLHMFKYGKRTGLRHFFVQQMCAFLTEYYVDLSQIDLIIPVPLHPSRLRKRGYNQSELLAQMLSLELKIPLTTKGLSRVRHTPNQARLTQKERWTNIEAAFKINNSNGFRDKRILVIDDLFTTGSTISHAAEVLKSAGATQVMALTLAIAVPEKHSTNSKTHGLNANS